MGHAHFQRPHEASNGGSPGYWAATAPRSAARNAIPVQPNQRDRGECRLECHLPPRAYAPDLAPDPAPPIVPKGLPAAAITVTREVDREQASDRRYLHVEHAAVFYLIPLILLLRDSSEHGVILALFFLATFGCFWWLRRDRAREARASTPPLAPLWNADGAKRAAPAIIGRFVVLGALITAAVWFLTPEHFLGFPRTAPGLWMRVMLLYPVLSVVPQELIWRAFFFQRYRAIFATPTRMILASAASFAFIHVLLENAIAVALTLVGGVLFATTYHRTRSLAAASFEHALYGCLVFTIGLGWYFYLGGRYRVTSKGPRSGPPRS